jgi:flagellar transcriptional activator FlhC
MTWQPNIHASLFLNIYENLQKSIEIESIDAIAKAWRLYRDEVLAHGVEPLLSVTRAWRLVRFVDSGMLCLTRCRKCGGQFVNHTYELDRGFTCGLCEPPARAGKAARGGTIH